MNKNINSKREHDAHWLHWWINAKSWFYCPKEFYSFRSHLLKRADIKKGIIEETAYHQRAVPDFYTKYLGESKRDDDVLPF